MTQTTTQLRQFTSNKPFKLVLSDSLERKIRTYCALSPNREWSGVLFYTFEGDFENGVTIYGNDFYLMDQGNGVHTEFDLNEPEITRYMVFEGLTDNCIGLCHSHNKMSAFFSGEDASTLQQYGNAMNNFVSLVVCNAGQYVARLTRKATINGTETVVSEGTVTTPLFNTQEVAIYPYKRKTTREEKGSYIEYIDLEIEKPEFLFDDACIERFGEISHKCSSEKATTLPGTSFKDFSKKKETIKDLTLFKYWDFEDDEDELSPDILAAVNKIPWTKLNFKGYFAQLMLGSPFAPPVTIESTEINEKYLKRFPNTVDFLFWFESWIDYMVAEFLGECMETRFCDDFSMEDLFLGKLYIEIGRLKFAYKKDMQQTILNRIS